jgi:UDP-N-acetylmuramoyl-tripeptide--D-alanyl-D-alanine ligase
MNGFMPVSPEVLYSLFLKHREISTDTRQIKPGSLFFALRGETFDGNRFADAALEQGAACAIIDDPSQEGPGKLLVADVLQSLQHLARMHRRNFSIPVLAITGSNGKTTTKELVNAVLSQSYRVTATKGNLNNHIGVPLTLLSMADDTELAIIEMGANHQGEIAELCRIAEPTHGLITNIGKAHLGGFGGFEGVIKAKSELYTWLREQGDTAFVNAENALLMDLSHAINRITYGVNPSASTRGKVLPNEGMLALEWQSASGPVQIQTFLAGDYNAENVLAAICCGAHFHVKDDRIAGAIRSYRPSNSRSQEVKTQRNTLLLDAYNANPTSMKAALDNFSRLRADHKMVILGDMRELGDESRAEHLAIAGQVGKSNFEQCIFVGPEFSAAIGENHRCFGTSAEAREWLSHQNISGFFILIKGSRGIRMENVVDVL